MMKVFVTVLMLIVISGVGFILGIIPGLLPGFIGWHEVATIIIPKQGLARLVL